MTIPVVSDTVIVFADAYVCVANALLIVPENATGYPTTKLAVLETVIKLPVELVFVPVTVVVTILVFEAYLSMTIPS